MLDTIPEGPHHKIVDCFGSPKSRQSWAQVSSEARRLTRQSDAVYYKDWLRDDFARELPIDAQPSAKDAYRAHLEISRQETARLLDLAQRDDVTRLIAGMTDANTRERLSNRYGKRPLADAGLQLARRLARPRSLDESPPRLREGELAALEHATRAIDGLARTQRATEDATCFRDNLRCAIEQAEQRVTRVSCPRETPPPAPRRAQWPDLYGP